VIGIGLMVSAFSSAYAAPIISNEELVSVSDDQVVITWITSNELSNSGIKWDLSPSLINRSEDTTLTNYHYITLTNLYPNTVYYCKISSQSVSGTTESTLRSFRTLARPSGNYLFTFATLTDLHYSPNQADTTGARGRPYAESATIISAEVAAINQFNPSFTIIKGDLMDAAIDDPNARIDELKEILDQLTSAPGMAKYYPIPGNHDKSIVYPPGDNWVNENLGVLYPPGASIPAGDSTFNYSFTFNGYRFIMLDSMNASAPAAQVKISSLEAELATAQANHQKAFVFMHHEASEESDIPNQVLASILDQPSFTPPGDWDRVRLQNKDQFFNSLNNYQLLNGEPVVATVFMGHLHDNRRRDFSNIPFVRTSSGLQFPTAFNIYKVYSNGYIQTFCKLPGFSEEISRDLITGASGEVTAARLQQAYLGLQSARNFTYIYSASSTAVTPEVSETIPSIGASNLALNQPISITFTKPMTKETSVSDWLALSHNSTIVTLESSSWSWNSSKTVLRISLPLIANQTYIVTIEGGSTGATAVDGTYLANNYSFSFNTGSTASTAPPVASINPLKNESGDVTNVASNGFPIFAGLATDEGGSTVSQVEFRIDNGNWHPTIPLDGAFDTSIEAFTFTITSEVNHGQHAVQIRTTNAAGISTTSGFTTYNFYIIGNKPEITLKADGKTIINGDPISPTPSLEITVVTDQTLDQLWLYTNSTRESIMPASPSFINVRYVSPTLTAGTHNISIEAVDKDSLNNTRISTKEAVNLSVQIAGDVNLIGPPLNYPNPFNAGAETTRIAYTLSRSSNVTLTVHDLAGNMIAKREFLSGQSGGSAGYNEVIWDGKSDGSDYVGNGIYLYLIIADGRLAARGKLTVLKR
jgi:hypothetical protein